MAEVEGKDCFDENILFAEFEADSNQKSPEYSSPTHEEEENSHFDDLKTLKEENARLKHVLKKLFVEEKRVTQEKPLFSGMFYNNEASTQGREKLEFFLQSLLAAQQESLSRLESCPENFSALYSNLQPSLEPLQRLKEEVTESERCDEEDPDKLQNRHCFSVINYTRYFDAYCIDSCGFPLDNWDPSNSEGWNVPIYEQVFFIALPCDKDNSKVRVKRGKSCFNCGYTGHNVSDCPEPQNLARIEAKRKEFINKFASPFAKTSRYHFDEKRFGAFKPGVISDKLREALGIDANEVPPYIYKMRVLGYPPGYIPSVDKPTLALYDADGNIDDYVMEDVKDDDDDNDESNKESLFVKYPGFNCSLPHGISDQCLKMGFPPMSHHQSIHNMERMYKQMHAQTVKSTKRNKGKMKTRKLDEIHQGAGDMEIDEEDEPQQSGHKRRKYSEDSVKDDEGGYSPSHPGIQYGMKEKELLEQLHQSSSSKTQKSQNNLPTTLNKPLIPGELSKDVAPHHEDVKPLKKKDVKRKSSTESVEDGEIISDEEVECGEVEEENGKEEKSSQGWWLTVPLTPSLKPCNTLNPPPVPAVQLPMDLLTRFYTNSTSLHRVSFEDRIMWLDPIYGNIQVSSGRYDKLKEILQKKAKRRSKK